VAGGPEAIDESDRWFVDNGYVKQRRSSKITFADDRRS